MGIVEFRGIVWGYDNRVAVGVFETFVGICEFEGFSNRVFSCDLWVHCCSDKGEL